MSIPWLNPSIEKLWNNPLHVLFWSQDWKIFLGHQINIFYWGPKNMDIKYIYILSYLVWTSYFFLIISIVLGGLVCFELKQFRSVFNCQPFCAQLSGAQGVWPWNSLSRCPMASEPFWWQSRRMWMNSSILPLAMEKNMRIFIKYDKTDHEIPWTIGEPSRIGTWAR